MKKNMRNVIRGLFLVIFLTLWLTGRAETWGQVLFLGLLVIPLWGRLYCGYLCPISTTIDILGTVKAPKKLSKESKEFFFNNMVRTVIFLVSIGLLITTIKTQFPIPFFVILIPIGVVFTYLFSEAAWHRNCFIGTMYSWLGWLSRKGYTLKDSCSGCGKCEKACPAGCLEIDNSGKESDINNKHCLVCGKCEQVCTKNNIFYGRLSKSKNKSQETASFN